MKEPSTLKPCYDIEPALDKPSVNKLLQAISDVLDDLWQNRHKLDDGWSTGCRAYGWVRNYLIQHEKEIPRLNMIKNEMDFVFTLNGIAMKFVTDNPDKLKKTHRLSQSGTDSGQLNLMFEQENSTPATTIVWRICAHKFYPAGDINEQPPTWILTLAGFDPAHQLVSRYELQPSVTTPIQPVDTAYRPAPVKTPATELQRRTKDDKNQNDEGNGPV